MSLLEEFNNMDKMPIIELKLNEEWDYFTINLEHSGIMWCFTNEDTIKMLIDADFSLDENLQSFYDLLIEHHLKNGYEIGE